MKKIFSLLLVMALMVSLAVPAFAATTSSDTRYASNGPVHCTYKYLRGEGKITNLQVKIHEFKTSDSYVRVEIGQTVFAARVTHKQEGAKIVSKIRVSNSGITMRYGFGSERNTTNSKVDFTITVKHYGNSVSAHTIYMNATYSFKSATKYQVWDKSVAVTSNYQTRSITHETKGSGSTSQGYFDSVIEFKSQGEQTRSFSEMDLAFISTAFCSYPGSSSLSPSLTERYWLSYN
jgi:hypothetical protein